MNIFIKIIVGLIFVAVVAGATGIGGYFYGLGQFRKDAIDAGAAGYEADEHGFPVFKFKNK